MGVSDTDLQLKIAVNLGLVDTDEMMKDIESSVKKVGVKAQAVSKAASIGMIGAASALAGLTGATIMGIRSLIAFEDSFAGVKKTVDADSETLAKLADQIRELATEIPIAATELARIGELGGQLGIGAENLEQFIEVVAKLGVATVLSTETAALALARLAAIANIPEAGLGEFFERTSSALVDLGNNFAATEDEIITTVLRIATAAKQTGASTQDALAFATALQAVGVPAQAGGTAIARVFQEMQRAIQAGGEQMNLFARVSGLSIQEFQKLFAEDAAIAVATFIQGLSTADEAGIKLQDTLQKLNLSQRRTQLAIGGLSTAGDLLINTITTSRNAFEENIALNIEASKKFTTTAQQILLLKNQFKEVTMVMAENFLPIARQIIFTLQAFAKGASMELITQMFKLARNMLLVNGAIRLVTIAWSMYTTGVLAAAKGSAIFKAIMMPSSLLVIGAAIAAVVIQFNKLQNIGAEMARQGGISSLSGMLGDAVEFGQGIESALKGLNEGLTESKSLLEAQSGFTFEDLYSQEGATNAEKIANAFKGKGLPVPSQKDLTNWGGLLLHIKEIEDQITNATTSQEIFFDNQIEKAKALPGGFGDIFKDIHEIAKGNSSLAGEAGSILESIFMGGGDPEVLITQFMSDFDAFKAAITDSLESERIDIYEALGITEDMDASEKQAIITEKASLQTQARLRDISMEIAEVAREEVDLVNHAQNFADLQKEQAMKGAELVDIANDQKDFSETELNVLAEKIQKQREEGREKALQAGVSADIVAMTEYSKDVIAAELVIQERMTSEIKEQAEATAFALSTREIAMMKVEAIAKKASETMVSLFDEVPDQVKATANEVVRNLQDQAIMGAKFIETIAELQRKGFVGLSAMLAKEGPKALAVAQQFLEDGDLALEAESRIATAKTSLLSELQEFTEDMGLTDDEIRKQFVEGGGNLMQGIAEGIRTGDTAIREALTETVNKGLEGFEIEFKISSPSRDKDVMDAGYEVLRGMAGKFPEGAKFFEDEMVRHIGEAAINAANRTAQDPNYQSPFNFTSQFVEDNPLGRTETTLYIDGLFDQLNELEKFVNEKTANLVTDYSSAKFKAILAETKGILVDTFDLYTSFTSQLNSIVSQTQAITDAERNLSEVKEYNLKLTEKQNKADEKYKKAIAKFGNENIVTEFESLQIKQAQLSLIRQQRDAAKSGSASERLAIKDAKRELQFLEQAAKRGVASEDEVQAARENLADLQGTTEGIDGFKDKEDYQEMLDLQKDINTLQIKFQKELIAEMKTASKELNDEVISAEKEKEEVANEILDSANKEAIAQAKVTEAKMAEYQTQLQLFGLADQIIGLGPEGEEQFRKIAKAVGMPEDEINNLIAQAKTMATKMNTQFNNVAEPLAKLKYDVEQGAQVTIEIQKALDNINKVKMEINTLYSALGKELPFPDIGIGETTFKSTMANIDKSLQDYGQSIIDDYNNFIENFNPDYPTPEKETKIDGAFAKGGFLGTGGLGLVGEIGPELIKVRPNGVDIRPIAGLERGGMGSGGGDMIIVESLAVNVTGVPSDPQSARKAAKSIERALVNLRKEGSSSGILGY